MELCFKLVAVLEPVAGASVASFKVDLIPLAVTLTALRIFPYKVGPIKALHFSYQELMENTAYKGQQYEHSNQREKECAGQQAEP